MTLHSMLGATGSAGSPATGAAGSVALGVGTIAGVAGGFGCPQVIANTGTNQRVIRLSVYASEATGEQVLWATAAMRASSDPSKFILVRRGGGFVTGEAWSDGARTAIPDAKATRNATTRE